MSEVILSTQVSPEDNAMLQALYSRSAESVKVHLKRLEATGSGKFMASFYLGYGHQSIADTGFVTLYFEGVSFLAAKAIQDNPLYNGQECSSRYIDFSNQPFHNPVATQLDIDTGLSKEVEELYEEYRSFYVNAKPRLVQYLKAKYPLDDGTADEKAITRHGKAIEARAFDILRGFLPAGSTTNLSWTTSLRKAHEILVSLMHHPLNEVNALASKAYALLYAEYPSSFREEYSGLDTIHPEHINGALFEREGADLFADLSNPERFYTLVGNSPESDWGFGECIAKEQDPCILMEDESFHPGFNPDSNTRHIPYPRHSTQAQTFVKVFTRMDFGSFRDLQRHRNGYCSMFVLGAGMEITSEDWYVEQLPKDLQDLAQMLDNKIFEFFDRNQDELDEFEGQYFYPLKLKMPVVLKYTLEQARYLAELRSGKTVHPTLRPLAQTLGKFLEDSGFQCNYDKDEDNWTLKRGDQDIVAKPMTLTLVS